MEQEIEVIKSVFFLVTKFKFSSFFFFFFFLRIKQRGIISGIKSCFIELSN